MTRRTKALPLRPDCNVKITTSVKIDLSPLMLETIILDWLKTRTDISKVWKVGTPFRITTEPDYDGNVDLKPVAIHYEATE